MTYTFTIQPDPIRISGVEAKNEEEAEAKVHEMLAERRDEFVKALMAGKWRMVLSRECTEFTIAEKTE